MEERDQTYEKPAVRDYGHLVEATAEASFSDDEEVVQRQRKPHHSAPPNR